MRNTSYSNLLNIKPSSVLQQCQITDFLQTPVDNALELQENIRNHQCPKNGDNNCPLAHKDTSRELLSQKTLTLHPQNIAKYIQFMGTIHVSRSVTKFSCNSFYHFVLKVERVKNNVILKRTPVGLGL